MAECPPIISERDMPGLSRLSQYILRYRSATMGTSDETLAATRGLSDAGVEILRRVLTEYFKNPGYVRG